MRDDEDDDDWKNHVLSRPDLVGVDDGSNVDGGRLRFPAQHDRVGSGSVRGRRAVVRRQVVAQWRHRGTHCRPAVCCHHRHVARQRSVTLLGNASVILAVSVYDKMRTLSNVLIASLGLADLLVAIVVMPISLQVRLLSVASVVKITLVTVINYNYNYLGICK